MFLDDKIGQKAYDTVVNKLNPQIEQLVTQINLIKPEEVNVSLDLAELKADILKQLNLNNY